MTNCDYITVKILRLSHKAGTKISGSPVARGDHFCSRAPQTFLLTRPCCGGKLSTDSESKEESECMESINEMKRYNL